MRGLTLVTGPAIEPISVPEARDQMRVDVEDEDPLTSAYIRSARQYVENFTRRQLITATWRLVLDDFPTEIWVPLPPLQSVTSLTYVDTGGDTQTLSTDVYAVETDPEPGIVRLKYNQTWPDVRGDMAGVKLTYVCGFGGAVVDIPTPIVQAVRMMTAHYHQQREVSPTEREKVILPGGVEDLLWPYRVFKEFE